MNCDELDVRIRSRTKCSINVQTARQLHSFHKLSGCEYRDTPTIVKMAQKSFTGPSFLPLSFNCYVVNASGYWWYFSVSVALYPATDVFERWNIGFTGVVRCNRSIKQSPYGYRCILVDTSLKALQQKSTLNGGILCGVIVRISGNDCNERRTTRDLSISLG